MRRGAVEQGARVWAAAIGEWFPSLALLLSMRARQWRLRAFTRAEELGGVLLGGKWEGGAF